MFDQNNEENNPEQEQEKFEDANEKNEEETSDYYSFDNIRNMALKSEHGSTVKRNDTLNEDGSYSLNLEDQTDEQAQRLKEKVYDYFAMNKVLNSMEFSETFPHMKYLEKFGLMDNIKVRYNQHGKLLGLDYKNKRVIVRGKRANEFEYGADKTAANAISEFKQRLQEAKAEYEETGSGMFESEARSEIGSTIRFNKESEKVSFENPQELEEMEEVVEEETEKAKFELIKEVEDDMEINRTETYFGDI